MSGGLEGDAGGRATLSGNTFKRNQDGIYAPLPGTSLSKNRALRNGGWGTFRERRISGQGGPGQRQQPAVRRGGLRAVLNETELGHPGTLSVCSVTIREQDFHSA